MKAQLWLWQIVVMVEGPKILEGSNFWRGEGGTLYWILISIVIWAVSVKTSNLLKTGTKDFSDVKLGKKSQSYICHFLKVFRN